ncbi:MULTISPECIES: ATP-binding cassette domain-containing protein [unclassified Diaminobutyricimonas]|uniref:ABC transporter ATP-binding protein n=1 Tax=unclassified Diaminobutyricimonas TaxID=2643261 RepID=UPI0012F48B08|nr:MULTISPECIES: ATP-binding cassette domain-containing protein [unclassified Diaminobutyricimonas]
MTLNETSTESAVTSQTSTVVQLEDVTIRYVGANGHTLDIVSDYDLALGAGQMHCLAGRSGSGKTSILRVAAGLAAPTSGDVRWAGESIARLSDARITGLRRDFVGYLDQGGTLIAGLTAIENVLLPAVPARRTKQLAPVAQDLLDRLGVGGRARHRPEQLSGGERQRVAFARSLLLSPRVLIVDEPTASLDRRSADSVIELLRGLTKDGIAVLVSAHDQNLIEVADSRTMLS